MVKYWAAVAALILGLITPRAQAADDVVKIGVVRSLAQAAYYVALEKGYFAEAHIKLDDSSFSGGQEMTSSLATGQLDIGLGAFNAGFFNAANQGLDLRAVAALGSQPHPVIATPPLVRKDLWDNGTIRSGKDLKGRKVAVNTPGATPEFTLSLILEKYGMTLKDVDETMIGFPQMVIALKNKAVDVAFVSEPFATIALKEGASVILAPEAGTTAGDITTVVFASGKFMRDRPQVLERFLGAVLRGAKFTRDAYNKNPAIAALLSKGTGIKQDVVEAATAFAFDPNLDIEHFTDSIRRQEIQHMKDGRLNYKTPIAMDKIVDATFIKKAMASPQ